jgi:hypothetical protein
MYPRPRARGPGRAAAIPSPEAIADRIAEIRAAGGEPAAIVASSRDWRRFRNQIGADELLEFWPGGDVTLQRVAIIIRVGFDAPKVVETQSELEALLLPNQHRATDD